MSDWAGRYGCHKSSLSNARVPVWLLILRANVRNTDGTRGTLQNLHRIRLCALFDPVPVSSTAEGSQMWRKQVRTNASRFQHDRVSSQPNSLHSTSLRDVQRRHGQKSPTRAAL
uniref:(northern house mosquito) hypothetical protein n=1 Tax=Culex pipiens TaxID=7175 RepID=A0A8D8KXE2_CULPI